MMRNEDVSHKDAPLFEAQDINTPSCDPILGVENERLILTKDLKEVSIGNFGHQ